MINYTAYSEMLTLQVEMCFPFEYHFYNECCLECGKNVVEIGCGNGAFLKTMKKYYPKNKYYGYDHCEELIKLAREDSKKIDFQKGSIEALNEHKADFVILRLIIHQVSDRAKFISTLSKQLPDDNKVIIIEPFDSKFQMSPNLLAFNEHLKKHRQTLSPNTASRNLKILLKEEMEAFGFRLDKETYYYVPSFLSGYKDKYYKYMIKTSEIIGCDKKVIDDINDWYKPSNAFAQIGVFMHCYTKPTLEKN